MVARRTWDEMAARARRGFAASVPEGNALWLPSFVSLGAGDVASSLGGASALTGGFQLLGVAGGAGLILSGARDWRRAVTTAERLDAASDLAWGAQGLLYLAPQSALAARLVGGLGLVGAAAQVAVGLARIRRGLGEREPATVKLGLLDLGGGLLWLGWDVLGWQQPLFVGTYVVLMVGREAYANRDSVVAFVRGAARRVLDRYGVWADSLADAWQEGTNAASRERRILLTGRGPLSVPR